MKKGIVIYAIGHRNYYMMAENLAASLLANGVRHAGVSIGLICDDLAKLRYPALFNDFIVLEKEQYMIDDKIVFNNATVLIYDLSPYDITMKLDADIIWMGNRPVKALFDSLNDVDIALLNIGHGWDKNYCVWASEQEVKARYGFSDEHKLYRILGEFLYFKKSQENKNYFDQVKAVYSNPVIRSHEFANGNMTDELALQIACMITGTYPHEDNYTPIFNQFLGLKEYQHWYPYQLPPKFFGYSIGGNANSKWTRNAYDNLAKHYFRNLGLQGPYLASNKKTFLPERQKH